MSARVRALAAVVVTDAGVGATCTVAGAAIEGDGRPCSKWSELCSDAGTVQGTELSSLGRADRDRVCVFRMLVCVVGEIVFKINCLATALGDGLCIIYNFTKT